MNYDQLFADALADVEAGSQRPCRAAEHCREMGGCPRCFAALMRGDIVVERIEVFRSGVIRITTAGHDGLPCTVAFSNVEVAIHECAEDSCGKQQIGGGM